HAGARASRQISARRTGRRALRTGPRETCGRASRARRRDVRLRPGRSVLGPLARPSRCAGLGGERAHLRGTAAAEGAGALTHGFHPATGATWLHNQYSAHIEAYQDAPKSLEELQSAVASPRAGYDTHHIAERTSALRYGFDEAKVDGPD